MVPVINVVEKITIIASVAFCFTLFYMLLRMKLSKVFDLRDYVSGPLSIDLDLKVLRKIRLAYTDHYKDKFIAKINSWSFIVMIFGIFLLSLLIIIKAFIEGV